MIVKALVLAVSLSSSQLAVQDRPEQTQPPLFAGQTAPQVRDIAPGSGVISANGKRLGVVERLEAGAAVESLLYVRGEDGTLRAVPATAVTVQNNVVILFWTQAEFEAAPVVQPEPVPPADEVTPPTRTPSPRPDPMDAFEPPFKPPAG